MKVTYFGTTMLLFDDGKDQVLFDCHVSRPGMGRFLFGKLETDRGIADRVLRDFDFGRLQGIFISHSHHDHVLDAPYFAEHCRAPIYGSASALNVARGSGVREDMLHDYRNDRQYRVGEFHITVLPSVHSRAHWYNNDLGKEIAQPLKMPARKGAFKEGGSYDFLIENGGKKYLIRPSYNYLEGQLDHVRADVLFLGIAGLSKDNKSRRKRFFSETIDKVRPHTVIPIHWDNFFTPLYGEIKGMPKFAENMGKSLYILARYCSGRKCDCIVQMPLTSVEL